MNNNRITIISPTDKRRKAKYNMLMFALLIVILALSVTIGFGYFQSKEDRKNDSNYQEYTTSTTLATQPFNTQTTTTTTTNKASIYDKTTKDNYKEPNTVFVDNYKDQDYVPTTNYIYNFLLVGDDYKIYVCNGDYVSRITNFKLYNKNDLLGESSDSNGLLINKNDINLTNKPTLSVELSGKKYDAKYNGRC